MGFNPATTKYEAFVLRGDGSKYSLNQLVKNLSWQEMDGDFVARASLSMANKYLPKLGCWTEHATPPGSYIFIFANGQEVFRGTVWNHKYNSAKGAELIDITACDRMIYLSQCKDSYYYESGQATIDLCANICQRWSIDMVYEYYPYSHGKIVMKNKSLMDQLSEVLTECQKKNNGRKFVAQFEKDVLKIRGQGYNDTVYVLTGGELNTRSLMNVQMETNLDKLVTRVNVLGKADNEGREPVEATIDGDLTFGTLQDQIYHDSDKSIDEARAEAQAILDEKGKPETNFSITAPDIPFIRKGHRIHCVFSSEINGYFYVKSITHNAIDKTMDLKLERA
ncbi:MAG: hypothetical protein EUB_03429 [Eubacterium sp.]|uniref:XkdQ/YqbQ family protein n=1 Tax=Eubacterium sp. TaxID=142586 RepID=UPI003047FEDD